MAIGRDMRLTSPELCEAADPGRARRRQRRRRDRPRRHRDAVLRRLRARLRGRPDRHRLAQPEAVQRHEDRAPRRAAAGRRRRHREGARPRAGGRVPHAGGSAGSAGSATCCRRSPSAASRSSTSPRSRRCRSCSTAPTAWPGRCSSRSCARLPLAGRALPLRSGRHVPALPAEPAARGEPPVHHRRGQAHGRRPRHRLGRRRRPLLLHRRHGRVRARRLHHRAASPSRCSRKHPGETILYDLRASRAVPDIGRARRRHGDREPRRPRLHQAPHAQGERALRRRGLGPLLLPRLLRRGHGHRARARRAGARLALGQARCPSCSRRCTSATTSRARSTRPSRDVPLKLQELKERYGDRGEGGRVTHLDGVSVDFDDWHFNVRPVQHRAAAAPQPRGLHARPRWSAGATRCWP